MQLFGNEFIHIDFGAITDFICLSTEFVHIYTNVCGRLVDKDGSEGSVKREQKKSLAALILWCPNSDSNAGPPPCDDGALTN